MDEKERFLRAISYAIAQGAWVDVSRLDINRSSEKNGEYLLRTSGMAIIARIPLEELAKVPIADFERMKEVGPEGLRAIRKVSGASVPEVQSPAVRAVAWASAMGYPIPKRMGGCASAILVVLGLCMFVVPGVLLLVWLFVEANQYDRDMKQLIAKWVDAGRPTPDEGFKEVTRLERIVEKVEDSAPQAASTEQRLLELNSMKEKGLITEDEYQAMRNKALDL